MDRAANNTLRTLGIIVIAVCVIITCGVLLLIALCFGALATMGHSHPQNDPTVLIIYLVALLIAVLVISGGTSAIARLARGYMPDPDRPQLPASRLVPNRAEVAAQFKELLPAHPQPRSIDVVAHLSPASSIVIQQLGAAIVAKIAAEVVLGIIGWYGALGVPNLRSAPFPLFRAGFVAWGIAAIAPHIVLLYALARRPSRTVFSYALIIPSLHIFFGLFGHSAFLAFILRAGQVAAPLLTIIPWLLDILILFLAWKAIRLTGLLPDPPLLVLSAVVIFIYSSLLPVFVILLNGFVH